MNRVRRVSCLCLIAGWMLIAFCGCTGAKRHVPPRQPQTKMVTAPSIEPALLEDGP